MNSKPPDVATRALVSGIACAVLAFTGCAAELEPGDTTGAPEIIEHSPEIIGELETADGARLTFTVEYEHRFGNTRRLVRDRNLANASVTSYIAIGAQPPPGLF